LRDPLGWNVVEPSNLKFEYEPDCMQTTTHPSVLLFFTGACRQRPCCCAIEYVRRLHEQGKVGGFHAPPFVQSNHFGCTALCYMPCVTSTRRAHPLSAGVSERQPVLSSFTSQILKFEASSIGANKTCFVRRYCANKEVLSSQPKHPPSSLPAATLALLSYFAGYSLT